MRGPPDPEMRGAVTRQSDSPVSQSHLPCTEDITETARDLQVPSLIEIQIFCLARRCAISAPMASAIAPLIWGWRS
jgi:hypothetical protein